MPTQNKSYQVKAAKLFNSQTRGRTKWRVRVSWVSPAVGKSLPKMKNNLGKNTGKC